MPKSLLDAQSCTSLGLWHSLDFFFRGLSGTLWPRRSKWIPIFRYHKKSCKDIESKPHINWSSLQKVGRFDDRETVFHATGKDQKELIPRWRRSECFLNEKLPEQKGIATSRGAKTCQNAVRLQCKMTRG